MSHKRKRDTTTLLPKSLRNEIESKEQGSQSRKSSHYGKKSRKEKRILDRTAKKERKAAYFALQSKRKSSLGGGESPVFKRRKVQEDGPKQVKNIQQQYVKEFSKGKTHERTGVATTHKKTTPKAKPESKPKLLLSQVEADEDREIAWLEYKLGISHKEKGKSLNKIMKKEGLDDLLDGLDDLFVEDPESGDEVYEEELSIEADDASPSSEEKEEEHNDDSEDEKLKGLEGQESEVRSDDDEQEEQDNAENSSEHAPNISAPVKPATYVPPHLRQASTDGGAERTRLLRHLKGLMNRLSEQNIATVLSSVEDIYRQNTRNDVTTCLTSVIVEGITSDASLLDNHICLNAAFVACLYRVVGIEFAAYFVQEIVTTFDNVYRTVESHESLAEEDHAGKEPLNVIVCIAELYNFEVISYVLIYDIIRQLISEKMGELEVELLLKIMRISGRQLRQDDPLALKDIVQLVSDKLSVRKGSLSSRTRFMIETLANLKNNRIKKADASGTESVDRLKKFISGLSKRHSGSDALRVTLKDLRSAETRGKWWLVGAAWAGDPLLEAKRDSIQEEKKPQQNISDQEKLLNLAKKQGMNTDIRRSIFVVLMSSDDYFDACERLSHLKLNEQQQREIFRVLLHCCGNERVYNPYYSLVGQKLCEQSYSYRITAQYCLWDFLRELGEQDVRGAETLKTQNSDLGFATSSVSKERVRNIAKLYAWWIARDSVSLTILKPIDLLRVKLETQDFLDTMFRDIFVNSQVHAPLSSSTGLASLWARGGHRKEPLEKLALQAARHGALAQGLLFYIPKMTKRCASKMKPDENKFLVWAAGTAKEALETGMSLVPAEDTIDYDMVV